MFATTPFVTARRTGLLVAQLLNAVKTSWTSEFENPSASAPPFTQSAMAWSAVTDHFVGSRLAMESRLCSTRVPAATVVVPVYVLRPFK